MFPRTESAFCGNCIRLRLVFGSSRLSVGRMGKALRFGFSHGGHGGQSEMRSGEGDREDRGAKSSRAKVAKIAKESRMKRPNTCTNQSCRSPYSACLRRETDLELQAREPNTVRPDTQRAAYSALGYPFAIFATFAREFRSSPFLHPPCPVGNSGSAPSDFKIWIQAPDWS